MVPADAAKIPRGRIRTTDPTVPKVMQQGAITPWLYLMPAIVIMFIFIVYPAANTFYLSFRNSTNTDWASASCVPLEPCWGILENYRYALTSEIMRIAFFNNLMWIVIMVTATVVLGLLVAVLADRVRYEPWAKALIFMPMAISFVGAGVIWKFVYDYRPGSEQIGLLNAIVVALGGQPVPWLTVPLVNIVALNFVGVWVWTGFCMTILAAAVKSVPSELLEAARLDGASEVQVFRQITVPIIMPTIAVVVTTMVINVLKIFDIVYVMTGGNYGTQVIANQMYIEQYTNFQTGRAAAIAVVLIAVILPAMYFNIRRFREQEATR